MVVVLLLRKLFIVLVKVGKGVLFSIRVGLVR